MSTWTRNNAIEAQDAIDWTAADGETIIETYWDLLDEQFAGLHSIAATLYMQRRAMNRQEDLDILDYERRKAEHDHDAPAVDLLDVLIANVSEDL